MFLSTSYTKGCHNSDETVVCRALSPCSSDRDPHAEHAATAHFTSYLQVIADQVQRYQLSRIHRDTMPSPHIRSRSQPSVLVSPDVSIERAEHIHQGLIRQAPDENLEECKGRTGARGRDGGGGFASAIPPLRILGRPRSRCGLQVSKLNPEWVPRSS